MNDRNRSEYVANQEWNTNHIQPKRPSWTLPSRCKRPPMKPAPSMLSRVLALLGVK